MALFSQIGSHVSWLVGVFRAIARHVGRPVWVAVACLVVARFARVIAFFIPLKVIILLGSDGIPRYFRFFITEETVEIWVGALSIGVFVLYAASIGLVTVYNRLIQTSAVALAPPLEGHARAKAVRNRRKPLSGVCESVSDLSIVVLGSLVLISLDWLMWLALAAVVTLQITAADRVLNGASASRPVVWLRKRLHQDSRRFLEYAEAMNYLVVFLFLLLDFVLFDGKNIIVAILILLMGRRVFQSLQGFAKRAIQMGQTRARVSKLLAPASTVPLAAAAAAANPPSEPASDDDLGREDHDDLEDEDNRPDDEREYPEETSEHRLPERSS